MTLSDDELEFQPAIENPEALAAAAQAMLTDDKAPDVEEPLDGPVTLPGGFRRVKAGTSGSPQLETVTKAWVRELTGEAEERIAKAKLKQDETAFLDAILEGGVERLGDAAPTVADLRALSIGDRDYLLLAISKATYGDNLEYEDYPCPYCHEPISFTVHKDEDIPVRRLDSVDDLEFEVRLKNDRIAVVRLPTGEEQSGVLGAETSAEANTLLIAACVSEIKGPKGIRRISGDQDEARRLGLADRQTILSEMDKHMPGPRYNEVKFTHPECEQTVHVGVSLGDLFRGL